MLFGLFSLKLSFCQQGNGFNNQMKCEEKKKKRYGNASLSTTESSCTCLHFGEIKSKVKKKLMLVTESLPASDQSSKDK